MATISRGDEPAATETAPSLQTTSHTTLPNGLHREPSQQDLEIARQLQSFQSQGANHRSQDREDAVSHSSRDAHEGQATSEHGGSVDGRNLGPTDTPLPSELHPQRPPSAEPLTGGQVCTNCGTTKTPLWRRSPTGAVICNACGLYFKARNQMRPVGLKRMAGPTAASTRPNDQSADRGTSPSALQGGATYVSADQSTNGTCPGGGRCNGTGGHDGCNGCPAYNNRISKTAQVALRQSTEGPDAGTGQADQQVNGHTTPHTVVVACQNCGTTITPLWRRDEAGNAICNACGLYYKLHGQHRPVQMKKAEIKRRKRVVPAALPTDNQYINDSEDGRTPDTRPTIHMHSHPVVIMEPRTGPGPIPVDFTDAFRSRQSHSESHDSIPSKRTYSETTEHYPHAQNMGFNPINAIDPTLPPNKEARRAELQREADHMRQMLQEKERELAALVDEA